MFDCDKCRIIAEAGVNHNGCMHTAKKMIEVAAESGANIVKFQTFKADAIVSKSAPKANYQRESTDATESQYEMLKLLELSRSDFADLFEHGSACGILVISTPFDLDSLQVLTELKQSIWKIASGEITNLPLLRKIGAMRQEVILSTGMAEISEIRAALRILRAAGCPDELITVLHCTTEYPTPMDEVNLKAMLTIKNEFPWAKVGYSDHTEGLSTPIAAAALGATVIEKHFTLDKNMEGPDHKASIDPEELSRLVEAVRNIEVALGDGRKRITPSEMKNKPIVRKSIVAAKEISCGDIFTESNITAKRPGTGISPMKWDDVLGKIATKKFDKDSQIVI